MEKRLETFYEARNALDTVLYYGNLQLTPAECSLFRYLLENVWYEPLDRPDWGYVNRDAIGRGTRDICRLLCLGASATKTATTGLETRGMIRRYPRREQRKGRQADDIEIIWLTNGVRHHD